MARGAGAAGAAELLALPFERVIVSHGQPVHDRAAFERALALPPWTGSARPPMTVHVGTSGWSYDHWEGVLYPPGTPLRARLEHYVARFQTVEVNSTYYRWPRDATFAGWRQRLPPASC